MLEIGKTLVSLDVLSKQFCCDLAACKGACCVYGDSGAPLTEQESQNLERDYSTIAPYMRPEGIQAVEKLGVHLIDEDKDMVTPLVNKEECAYVVFENGVALCAIEQAGRDGVIDWLKPLSCHLYPIRIKKYKHYDAVNFDEWDICKLANEKGKKLGLPAYVFVKDALIRSYGQDWYDQLDYAAKNLELEN